MPSDPPPSPPNPAMSSRATFSEDATPPDGENHHPTDSKGWDGKLRVGHLRETAPSLETLSDVDQSHSGDDGPPVDQIAADEGKQRCPVIGYSHPTNALVIDLLDDYPVDTEEIDLVHCRISSIPALRIERFTKVQRLCLRQNSIEDPTGLSCLAPTLEDLDLYDNLVTHIKGLEQLTKLTSLDLSFNKIKHIKRVNHLTELRNLYFVQNKIAKIENLDGLVNLRNLELAANRLREIENLDSLTALEELWLGKNKISELKDISHLQNLKILSIQSNRLTRIEGLDSLLNLEEVYVSHNALTEISGLDHNVVYPFHTSFLFSQYGANPRYTQTNLNVLDISNNQISNLANIAHLKNLKELWASNNKLSSFEEVERELRDKEDLNTVYFEGNPLQLSNRVTYRNKLRLALPQVMQIDASELILSRSRGRGKSG